MKHIELLDCTLRDGGHITNSYFGEEVIRAIIDNLIASRVDIIEAGFLQNCQYDRNRAMFNSVAEAKPILPPKTENSRFSLMAQADLYDFDKLEPWDGSVDMIRISFHDIHIEEGFAACKRVIELGYQCFINPINIMGYTDAQLLGLIERVNELHPYGFAMVDTFGSMQKQDLMRIYHIIDHNLDSGIRISVHLHENQSLSYSLAQNFIDINSPTRDICIDGSLYGMGRVPGNLCIELIMKYMNENLGASYDIEPVYDAIDEYIMEIKRKNPWGYSIAYALSAQHKVHRTYAEYLMSQGRLKTKQINQILSQIDDAHKTGFKKDYIEGLYAAYQSHSVEDEAARKEIKELIDDRRILILAPGGSIQEHEKEIQSFVSGNNCFVISTNFVWSSLKPDLAFFSNIRRWTAMSDRIEPERVVLTSNLLGEEKKGCRIVNYSDYAYYKDQIADNCILMLIKLLESLGIREIYFAGFDGFGGGRNFASNDMERDTDHIKANEMISEVLKSYRQEMSFKWVTPSIFDLQPENE